MDTENIRERVILFLGWGRVVLHFINTCFGGSGLLERRWAGIVVNLLGVCQGDSLSFKASLFLLIQQE